MKPHIIITGGAQGIGKITTIELLKQDYCISVFDEDIEALNEMRAEINSEQCSIYHVNVADEKNVTNAISESVNPHCSNLSKTSC